MLRRYRTLNNDTEVNVDGARLRAGDDGVFVVEAGSRAEDVLIAGGAISAHLFSLLFDDAGNLIANVNLRTGHLADLLLIEGGDGEVAVADDVDALVVYKGTPGVGKAYYMGKESLRCIVSSATSNIVTATPTTLKLTSVLSGTASVADLVNEYFILPASGFTEFYVEVNLSGVSGDGTYRKLVLEAESTPGAGDWNPINYATETLANVSGVTDNMRVVFSVTEGIAEFVGMKLRVRFTHDKTTNMSVIGNIALRLKNYA